MASDYEKHEVEVLPREGALLINDGYRARKSELSNTGIPFARAENIDGGFHFEDADHVPAHTSAKVGLKRSLVGDVVFTSKGTVDTFRIRPRRNIPIPPGRRASSAGLRGARRDGVCRRDPVTR